MIQVQRAELADLDALVGLFDAYRQFYRNPSDLEGARLFLTDRLERHESVIFLALRAGTAVGFTQLFPSFSSSAMQRIFILNDLYVTPTAQRSGIGSALIDAAVTHGREQGAARLTLSTELSNKTAQALYEARGWRRDTTFCVYNLALTR